MKVFFITIAMIIVGLLFFPRLTIVGLIIWGVALYFYNFNWSY